MLAMYSESPLNQNANKSGHNSKGFIASVTNKKVFYLLKSNKNARIAEYNDYYLTYGNMEIQFQIGSDKLELKIGHNYRSFDTGNYINS
jgi:hypothetical protein